MEDLRKMDAKELDVKKSVAAPLYTLGEEIANSITHGIGACLSLAALALLVVRAATRAPEGATAGYVVGYSIFGASLVTLYTKPSLPAGSLPLFADISTETLSPELIASITPLGKMKLGILPGIAMGSGDVVWGLRDVVVGNVAGAIGEVSAVVIAAAAIYLLVRRVITWHIPVSFVGTVAVLTFLFPRGGNAPWLWMLYSVCSGGLFFGAAFMATDYTTSPVTSRGKLLYGALCGVLTVLIRYFGAHEDGVMYAILVMNCATALVDRYIRPRRFGVRIKKHKEEAENE